MTNELVIGSVLGLPASRNHYRFRCQPLSKNSKNKIITWTAVIITMKSVTKHPCIDDIDLKYRLQINQAEIAAKVDRIRNVYTNPLGGWCRIVRGCQH